MLTIRHEAAQARMAATTIASWCRADRHPARALLASRNRSAPAFLVRQPLVLIFLKGRSEP
jgi:hypothetical protein